MNINYSIFIASFYACTAACSFREASFLNSFQSYKIHSFKIVFISSIRFLRQWSFTMCSVDGSGKPCLDIDHCVMLGKASVNMFIVFSSLLNNQWILISPSLANSNVVCEIPWIFWYVRYQILLGFQTRNLFLHIDWTTPFMSRFDAMMRLLFEIF